MPQIDYLEPPDVRDAENFNMYMFQNHDRCYGIGSGTKGTLDDENIPTLDISGAIAIHIADTTIHFTQASISITESQISNFGTYEQANSNIQTHIADSDIHFTVASIDHESLLGLPDDDHPGAAWLAGRSGGQTYISGTDSGDNANFNTNTSSNGQFIFGDKFLIDESTGNVGIGTASPDYLLDVAGTTRLTGLILEITTKTANYTATLTDDTITCDATSGVFTITLPTALNATGKIFNIKKIDSSGNVVTADGDGAETIDGALTKLLSSQNDTITIQSDGSQWWIL